MGGWGGEKAGGGSPQVPKDLVKDTGSGTTAEAWAHEDVRAGNPTCKHSRGHRMSWLPGTGQALSAELGLQCCVRDGEFLWP